MKLEEIGFYTLSDNRAATASVSSPMWRCEMLLTGNCNFNCLYCRGMRKDCRGDMPLDRAIEVLNYWAKEGLVNIRFSGGEPMLYPYLSYVVSGARARGVERIALSTNGSFPLESYLDLIECGVNDFSISLDACCAADANRMAGIWASFDTIINNIKELSSRTYVTVGIVLTRANVNTIGNTVRLAHDLGVDDIRIISAAQWNELLGIKKISEDILDAHPILKYRVGHFQEGRNVRGLCSTDVRRCYLVLDDSAVAGEWHFPCIIYLREGGDPIGKIGDSMRIDRYRWFVNHDTYLDPICRNNCLDVCLDYNTRCQFYDLSKGFME